MAVTPSAPATPASWTQDLTFSGDVAGHMTGIVADSGDMHSGCTGAKPRIGQTWADEFYGMIDTSGNVWGLDFVIQNYGGPGTYKNQAVTVQLHSADNTQVWQNQPADAVTFTLERSQETGTIDAKLTSADTGKAGAVHITGTWNCKA